MFSNCRQSLGSGQLASHLSNFSRSAHAAGTAIAKFSWNFVNKFRFRASFACCGAPGKPKAPSGIDVHLTSEGQRTFVRRLTDA